MVGRPPFFISAKLWLKGSLTTGTAVEEADLMEMFDETPVRILGLDSAGNLELAGDVYYTKFINVE